MRVIAVKIAIANVVRVTSVARAAAMSAKTVPADVQRVKNPIANAVAVIPQKSPATADVQRKRLPARALLRKVVRALPSKPQNARAT